MRDLFAPSLGRVERADYLIYELRESQTTDLEHPLTAAGQEACQTRHRTIRCLR